MDNGESSYRRFLEGSNEGMLELVCEYNAGLVLYINSLVQNIHEAEDLAEDTFLEIMIKRPKFSGKSSFRTWLYAIGRNVVLQHMRKHRNLSTVPLESEEYLADNENIENSYIKTERRQTVHKALQSLKLEYRQVLFLNYFEEFSISEISVIMKKSEKQVKNLLYNAKKALKSELERSGFEYEE